MLSRRRDSRPQPRSAVTRALVGLVCAFVLLAQHVAFTHALWHAAPASLQAHEIAGDAHDEGHGAAPLCAFDAAFGQLLSATPTTDHHFAFDTPASQRALSLRSACATADALTPRSRGPPTIL